MRTDRAVRRPSSEPVAVTPIVDRQTPVKTLPSLAVGKNKVVTEFRLFSRLQEQILLMF